MAGDLSPRDLAELLNLRDSEAETLKAVLAHCSKVGVAMGGFAAVGTATAGAITVPGIGSVPGWLVGFAAGWVSGTAMCTMAHRGIVIEGLKQILSDARHTNVGDNEAIAMLRSELDRLRNPERPEGFALPAKVADPRAARRA
jgi:hypothetical protein